jgi:hypothetical protein
VAVLGHRVRHRRVEDLFVGSGYRERAVDLTGHFAAIDHLPGHISPLSGQVGKPATRPFNYVA